MRRLQLRIYMKKSKFLTAVATILLSSTILVNAAPNISNDGEKSELNADEVEYDMDTGIITATGNVILKHGIGTATGLKAMYNLNTEEAYLTGNVIVVRDNLRLTCDSLTSDGGNHMQADGNVHAEQKVPPTPDQPEGDLRTFTGDHVDYYPNDKQHILISSGGLVQSKQEGTFTADHMEGWLDDQYYVGTGNAHLISPPRDLEAGGDRIDYYAADNGRAVLSGNAWAHQDNNTLKGNRLTVYLADKKKEKSQQPENPFSDKKRGLQINERPSMSKPFEDVEKIEEGKDTKEDKNSKEVETEKLSDNKS